MPETSAPASGPIEKEIAELSFEQALEQLNRIVGLLETGEAGLEDSIRAYERGIALKRHCEARLADAQARVEAITLDATGAPAGLAPFEPEN